MSEFSRSGSPIIPSIRYRDAVTMIEWLCLAVRLTYRNGMIMIGSARNDASGELQAPLPTVDTQVCQSPYVVVSDVDQHHERAAANGAQIVLAPEDQAYGGRLYSCHDPEGNLWNFGSYDPWAWLDALMRRVESATSSADYGIHPHTWTSRRGCVARAPLRNIRAGLSRPAAPVTGRWTIARTRARPPATVLGLLRIRCPTLTP